MATFTFHIQIRIQQWVGAISNIYLHNIHLFLIMNVYKLVYSNWWGLLLVLPPVFLVGVVSLCVDSRSTCLMLYFVCDDCFWNWNRKHGTQRGSRHSMVIEVMFWSQGCTGTIQV